MPAEQLCVICHHSYFEYGNNAEPVAHGRCCNRCNDNYVIPALLRRMRRRRRDHDEAAKHKS